MGIFNKLKEILFDEETVEIPVITKEDKKGKEIKQNKSHIETKDAAKRTNSNDDEVVIRQIETPKREIDTSSEDTLYDMPKFKSDQNAREVEEKKVNTFTFPVFEDEEPTVRRTDKNRDKREETKKKPETHVEKESKERTSGYTNAYDYSYGKYKGDYMSSRESSHEYLEKALEEKEEKKSFTPSPIISPVYGVLNENYKKEDIVTKSEHRPAQEALDLDSVRRKAYGTLEDELEAVLTNEPAVEEVGEKEYFGQLERKEETEDTIDDSGISIDDLLVDNTIDTDVAQSDTEEFEIEETREEDFDETELFKDLEDEDSEVIEIDKEPQKVEKENVRKAEPIKIRRPELDRVSGPRIPDDVEELKMNEAEQESDTKEEDLFDLIDSLYEGKDEE